MLTSIVRRWRGSAPAAPITESAPAPSPGQQDAASFQLESPLEGVELAASGSIETPFLEIGAEHELWLAVAQAPRGGSIRVACKTPKDEGWTPLATLDLRGPATPGLRLSLAAVAGNRAFRVSWLGDGGGTARVTLLRICPALQAGRVNALANYRDRLAREVEHFSGQAYTHAMYGEQQAATGHGAVHAAVAGPAQQQRERRESLALRARESVARIEPQAGEVAFNYAMRALSSLLPLAAPDFFQRAHDRSVKGPMRILSILAGAARVEEQMVSHCPGEVELVLMDASPDLIQRAADRLSGSRAGLTVSCLVGDINNGLPGDGHFDVIVCVSALHHVAGLEGVLAQVNDRLTDDGEFWNIGEQVGRNGNRLWPEAYIAANEAFMAMPAKYRRNAHTNKIDERVSDHDYSTGCFEGIRSEELETLLEANFIPVDVYKRNAFLWRLVDATYSDNFVLSQTEDLRQLRELVVAEAVHWASGGRSTELHGVYRKKYLKT